MPYKEFGRLMRGIRDQTRDYPQEALEQIFDYLDVIEKRASELMDMSPSLIVTALSPHIGYAKAAALVKRALAERRSLIDVALDEKVMKEADLRRILDPLPHGVSASDLDFDYARYAEGNLVAYREAQGRLAEP